MAHGWHNSDFGDIRRWWTRKNLGQLKEGESRAILGLDPGTRKSHDLDQPSTHTQTQPQFTHYTKYDRIQPSTQTQSQSTQYTNLSLHSIPNTTIINRQHANSTSVYTVYQMWPYPPSTLMQIQPQFTLCMKYDHSNHRHCPGPIIRDSCGL